MNTRDSTRARGSTRPRAPHDNSRPPRSVSLRLELSEIGEAVLAARLVADLIAHGGAQNAEDAMRAPGACSAVLAIVDARLRLVDAVLAGDVDARALLGSRNEVRGDRNVEGDILLRVGRRHRHTDERL